MRIYSGDVNLFLNDPEDDCSGEIEVMIAEPRARLKGCASEAVKLMMSYCYDKLHISRFVAKIGKHNLKSYSLFKNKVNIIIIKQNEEKRGFESQTPNTARNGGLISKFRCKVLIFSIILKAL